MPVPIEVSDSQFKSYQACPRKWGYVKLLDLRQDENKDSMHLGNAFHDGMEEYMKTGSMDKAHEAAIKALIESKPTNLDYVKMLVPSMLIGMALHWVPSFLKEFEPVSTEEWFTSTPNEEIVRIRGFKDLVAKHRQTGQRCVFDYKTSSDMYFRTLASTLESNNQLARYATAERRQYGSWPMLVALVFAIKPKSKDVGVACENARCDPSLYRMLVQQVTPKFAEFALAVEQNDILMAQQMKFYRDLVAERGPQACDYIPANFDNCFNYGSMCGFAQGCHSAHPAHQNLKKAG